MAEVNGKWLSENERIEKSKGERCFASWRVHTIYGIGYKIECRVCGALIQSDFVPKCLIKTVE